MNPVARLTVSTVAHAECRRRFFTATTMVVTAMNGDNTVNASWL